MYRWLGSRRFALAQRLNAGRLPPSYRRLWAAEVASAFGDGLRATTVALLAARLSTDPRAVSAVAFAAGLPWFLFSLIAGPLADRVNARSLLITLRWALGAVSCGLALTVVAGQASLSVLYVTSFLLSTGFVFSYVALPVLLVGVVDKASLVRANARLTSATIALGAFIGPPLAGFLFAWSPSVTLAVDCASFLVGALLLRRVHAESVATTRTSTSGIRYGAAIKWLLSDPTLRAVAVVSPVLGAVFMAVFAVQVLFAQRHLGMSALAFGLLGSFYAAGSVLGSLLAPRLHRRFGDRRVIACAILIFGLTSCAIGASKLIPVVIVCHLVLGSASLVFQVTAIALQQSLTPRHLLGRVSGVVHFVGQGASALGALAGGIVAARLGLAAPYWITGGTYGLVAVVMLVVLDDEAIKSARARLSH